MTAVLKLISKNGNRETIKKDFTFAKLPIQRIKLKEFLWKYFTKKSKEEEFDMSKMSDLTIEQEEQQYNPVRLTITVDLDATEQLKEILFAEKTTIGGRPNVNEKLELFIAEGLFGARGMFSHNFIPSEYLGDEGMVLRKVEAEELEEQADG